MPEEKRFLIDVGMRKLPFPIKVTSRVNPDGQFTIADVSVSARINQEFEANWISKFIQVLHMHRDRIGTSTLRANVFDYMQELKATTARIEFDYPFFMEKKTPVSNENYLVRYLCTQSAKITSLEKDPKILFKIDIPVITTDPASTPEKSGGLYGQLSIVSVEVESSKDIFPEDLIDIVDKHALSPVYSFLAPDDRIHIIQKVHTEKKSSVVMTDEIKEELARREDIEWFSVRCNNHGMLHSYSTLVSTEKSAWMPFSGYDDDM